MSYPPPPPDPNDPWARPPEISPARDPYSGGEPYAQPTYGGPSAPYGQPGYGYPAYGAPYTPYGFVPQTNGKATAALWTGIGSLVLTFCCGGGGILGIVAIVLGVVARGEINRSGGQQPGGGMAIAGIVTGSIALVLGLVVVVLLVLGLALGDSTSTGVRQTQV